MYPYQKAIQVAFQEVSDALIALQKSCGQLVVIGRQVDALRTYFARISHVFRTYSRLARLRYEGGYTSYIEVPDAGRMTNRVYGQAGDTAKPATDATRTDSPAP